MNKSIIQSLSKHYSNLFTLKGEEVTVFAPGRINLLGEHIDYNDGVMLPTAIDLGLYLIGNRRNDRVVYLYASAFDESFSLNTTKHVEKCEVPWANYIIGVIAQFQKRNIDVPGFNLAFDGDLPIGAGLSSSAALECAVVTFINQITNANINKIDLLKMAQKSEHEFAGVQCGIMDQFASMMSKKDHLILLDSVTLDFEYLKMDLGDFCFVLINSNVEHSLMSSEYNLRRKECEQVLSKFKTNNRLVVNFRDCTLQMLKEIKNDMEPALYKRAKYVIEEMHRVKRAIKALNSNDLTRLGEIMYETHLGLSEDYEVSCKELDFLCGFTLEIESVLGARMMGGGFGGCTLNLIRKDSVDLITNEISIAYKNKFKIEPTIIPVNLGSGASIIEQNVYI